jgi:hypothetical protein
MSEPLGLGAHTIYLAEGLSNTFLLEDQGPKQGVSFELRGQSVHADPCAISILPDKTNGYPICGAVAPAFIRRGRFDGFLAEGLAEITSNRNQINLRSVGDDFQGTLIIKLTRSR